MPKIVAHETCSTHTELYNSAQQYYDTRRTICELLRSCSLKNLVQLMYIRSDAQNEYFMHSCPETLEGVYAVRSRRRLSVLAPSHFLYEYYILRRSAILIESH